MNNADINKESGSDAEARKADVLRAKDIIPPLKAPTRPAPDLQQAGQKSPPPPAEPQKQPEKEPVPCIVPEIMAEQVKPVEGIQAEHIKTEQPKSEIPTFNLAEKIMAEQRRITAVRRKGPDQQEAAQEQEEKPGSVLNTTKQVSPALSEQEQIITEIVARDIERLYRSHTSGVGS